MAVAISRNVGKAVTLATTVTRLTQTTGEFWSKLCLMGLPSGSSVGTVYIITNGTADGEALPSTGRVPVAVGAFPFWFDVTPFSTIGLAGDVAGDVEVLVT
jgi:hypothetical protein